MVRCVSEHARCDPLFNNEAILVLVPGVLDKFFSRVHLFILLYSSRANLQRAWFETSSVICADSHHSRDRHVALDLLTSFLLHHGPSTSSIIAPISGLCAQATLTTPLRGCFYHLSLISAKLCRLFKANNKERTQVSEPFGKYSISFLRCHCLGYFYDGRIGFSATTLLTSPCQAPSLYCMALTDYIGVEALWDSLRDFSHCWSDWV